MHQYMAQYTSNYSTILFTMAQYCMCIHGSLMCIRHRYGSMLCMHQASIMLTCSTSNINMAQCCASGVNYSSMLCIMHQYIYGSMVYIHSSMMCNRHHNNIMAQYHASLIIILWLNAVHSLFNAIRHQYVAQLMQCIMIRCQYGCASCINFGSCINMAQYAHHASKLWLNPVPWLNAVHYGSLMCTRQQCIYGSMLCIRMAQSCALGIDHSIAQCCASGIHVAVVNKVHKQNHHYSTLHYPTLPSLHN